jgi:methionine-R-sulfoxide reductase
MNNPKKDLRDKLTPAQYGVACEGGTEPAFNNEYWDNKREGIYVDIISGKPLFFSGDKFESGTGWPSFTQSIDPGEIVEKKDKSQSEQFAAMMQTQALYIFPIFTVVIFWGLPSALGVYWITTSIFSIIQQYFILKSDPSKDGHGAHILTNI